MVQTAACRLDPDQGPRLPPTGLYGHDSLICAPGLRMKIREHVRRTAKALTTGKTAVDAQAWKCPDDGEIVLIIPSGEVVPKETEQVQCPNGHWVTVPKYRGPEPEAEEFYEAA